MATFASKANRGVIFEAPLNADQSRSSRRSPHRRLCCTASVTDPFGADRGRMSEFQSSNEYCPDPDDATQRTQRSLELRSQHEMTNAPCIRLVWNFTMRNYSRVRFGRFLHFLSCEAGAGRLIKRNGDSSPYISGVFHFPPEGRSAEVRHRANRSRVDGISRWGRRASSPVRMV